MEKSVIDQVIRLTREKTKIEKYLHFINDRHCGIISLGWGKDPYDKSDDYGLFFLQENQQMKDILKKHQTAIINELMNTINNIDLQLSKL